MKIDQAVYEDFLAGYIVSQITMFTVGLWSLAIGIVSGLLWIAGGRGWLGTKSWRRIGVPLVLCIPFGLSGHLIGASISFGLQIAAQSIGYGEPSPGESGSWLGRLFGEWTRLAWFIILGLTLIPLFL